MNHGPAPNSAACTADFEFGALQEAERYRAALLDEFRPWLRGRVIEIGAGIGQMTAGLRALDGLQELLCVEPDAGFCRKFREIHPDQKLIEGTVNDVQAGEAWDAILSINVLEHIQEDALELAAYRALLAAGRGSLCLFVPARPELYAPIDRDFGHYRRYRLKELRGKLESAGFEVERLRYFNFAGYFAWGLGFRLLGNRRFNRRAVRLFDRVIFPPQHWLETRVCPPPFGQSLLAVGRARP